jgi:hypothetical protein
VSTPSTVGVDDDLSSAETNQKRQASQFESTSTQMAEVYSRQTGVSLGTSDNESAGRLDLRHQKETDQLAVLLVHDSRLERTW